VHVCVRVYLPTCPAAVQRRLSICVVMGSRTHRSLLPFQQPSADFCHARIYRLTTRQHTHSPANAPSQLVLGMHGEVVARCEVPVTAVTSGKRGRDTKAKGTSVGGLELPRGCTAKTEEVSKAMVMTDGGYLYAHEHTHTHTHTHTHARTHARTHILTHTVTHIHTHTYTHTHSHTHTHTHHTHTHTHSLTHSSRR
jgi:hypothetical protein